VLGFVSLIKCIVFIISNPWFFVVKQTANRRSSALRNSLFTSQPLVVLALLERQPHRIVFPFKEARNISGIVLANGIYLEMLLKQTRGYARPL